MCRSTVVRTVLRLKAAEERRLDGMWRRHGRGVLRPTALRWLARPAADSRAAKSARAQRLWATCTRPAHHGRVALGLPSVKLLRTIVFRRDRQERCRVIIGEPW